jgi:hypothetical protein
VNSVPAWLVSSILERRIVLPKMPVIACPWVRWLITIGCLAWIAGCTNNPFSQLSVPSPFGRQVEPYDSRYGPLPAERLEFLQSLGEDAGKMTADQRQRFSRDLVRRLESTHDPLLREQTVRTLGALATPEADDALRRAGADHDPDVRVAACEAWQRRGGPAAVAALGHILSEDGDVDVRLAATRALEKMASPEAVRALAVALDDSDPALQYRAVQALRSVSGQDFGSDLDAWRQFASTGNLPQRPPSSLAQRLFPWWR